jgi:hypothetical protein
VVSSIFLLKYTLGRSTKHTQKIENDGEKMAGEFFIFYFGKKVKIPRFWLFSSPRPRLAMLILIPT